MHRQRPGSFPNDLVFVRFVEERVNLICGLRTEREEKAKQQVLGSRPRLNRAFDIMGVRYGERSPFASGDEAASAVLAVPAVGRSRKAVQKAPKRMASEPEDVRIGHDLARPVKRSKKVSFEPSMPVIEIRSEGEVRLLFVAASFLVSFGFILVRLPRKLSLGVLLVC